ncbi:MAG: DUF3343 domain-containing protein [Oscillospiraceae bacterium]|jgi:hypothetical protein|nr:DUF3343 domain-containing protein [Oscillospiraceae bacterium]
MPEIFGIAAFRSRQQVLRFESALKRAGVRVQVVSTPRDVAVGCGLSVRFDMQDADRVVGAYRQTSPSNLIGFYQVTRTGNGRPDLQPIFQPRNFRA